MKRLSFPGAKCCANRPSRAGGFTLIEVLVAMVILSILVGISISSIAGNLPLWRLQGATNEMVTIFQKARALAVKKNKWTLVTFTGVNSPGSSVVSIYLDVNNSGTKDAGDTVLHNLTVGAQYTGAYVKSAVNGAAGPLTVIMLAPDGTVKPTSLVMPVDIVMASSNAKVTRTYTVRVERSGLARIR